jgi:hypothetical protein
MLQTGTQSVVLSKKDEQFFKPVAISIKNRVSRSIFSPEASDAEVSHHNKDFGTRTQISARCVQAVCCL